MKTIRILAIILIATLLASCSATVGIPQDPWQSKCEVPSAYKAKKHKKPKYKQKAVWMPDRPKSYKNP